MSNQTITIKYWSEDFSNRTFLTDGEVRQLTDGYKTLHFLIEKVIVSCLNVMIVRKRNNKIKGRPLTGDFILYIDNKNFSRR